MQWSVSNQVLSIDISTIADEEIGVVEVTVLACLHNTEGRQASIMVGGNYGHKTEEVGQGHVHKVSNCRVGQKKFTNPSIVMNRSCSQTDPRINLMQQGSRAGNTGSRMQLMI